MTTFTVCVYCGRQCPVIFDEAEECWCGASRWWVTFCGQRVEMPTTQRGYAMLDRDGEGDDQPNG